MPLGKHKGNMLESLENCRAWPTEGEAGVAAGAPPEAQGAGSGSSQGGPGPSS